MKVLCLTPWFPRHDEDKEGNFVRDSVESLERDGHEVQVLVTRPWRPAGGHDRNGAATAAAGARAARHLRYLSIPRNHLRGLSNWLYKARVAGELEEFARTTHADVIHVHTELPAITAVAVARKLGIPSVVTLHGINPDPRLHTPKQDSVLRRALGGADRVVLVGEPLRAFFGDIVKRSDHFRIVHNGFRAPGDLPPRDCGWSETVRLVSVSNLHEGKGIELTLQALAELKARGLANWHYTIVGGGYLERPLRELAGTLGLPAQVSFAGFMGHSDVYRHLRQADIFVLPSYREAFGIAYLEAMACGLLAIGVEGQGPSAFIEDGRTGILVRPRDASHLAARLSDALRRPAEMQEIARRGQALVTKEFTWERHAAQLGAVFAEAVKERSWHANAS